MIELERVYGYYVGGGLASLVLARGLDVLRGAWVVLLSLWLGACVDYSRLADSPHLAALVSPRCTAPFAHPTSALVLLLLLAAFVVRLRALVRYYRALLPVQHYCRTKLHLVDDQLASTPWNSISPLLEPPDPTLLAHRIMRKQNYLIAIFNKSILPLELHCTLLGRRITLGGELTTALEWNLSFCIFGLLLDPSGRLLPAVLIPHHRPTLVEKLRRRFILMGVINLLFSPLIILYLLLYFFLRYFSQYHQNPSTLSTRQFTRLAEWKFREFCELPHLFRERLGRAMPLGDRYLAAWKREKINLGLRFVAFIAGSLATVLVVFSLLDPDAFLHFEITKDRTVFFYIGVFGAILAVSRGMIIDPLAVQERPEELMNQIILHTHYSPASWSNLLHTPFVQGEFSALYKLKIVIFLTEIASVVLTPLILIYEMAEESGRIVDFFREFTVEVEGVGLVCSFAVFDFGRYGDPRFGGGVARPKVVDEQEAGEGTRKSERVERERERERERARCTEGKMEKSFLNFTAQNPTWVPRDQTQSLFLSKMTEFISPPSSTFAPHPYTLSQPQHQQQQTSRYFGMGLTGIMGLGESSSFAPQGRARKSDSRGPGMGMGMSRVAGGAGGTTMVDSTSPFIDPVLPPIASSSRRPPQPMSSARGRPATGVIREVERDQSVGPGGGVFFQEEELELLERERFREGLQEEEEDDDEEREEFVLPVSPASSRRHARGPGSDDRSSRDRGTSGGSKKVGVMDLLGEMYHGGTTGEGAW